MAEITGGRLAAKQLKASGIDTIFTVLAGPATPILIGAVQEGIRVVACRHDMDAAMAASAYGYAQQKPGVAVVGAGPGFTNTITPLYVATESAMPLVVLGGSYGSSSFGRGAFQETDHVRFAVPASKWASRVHSIREIPDMVHMALGKSISGRPGGTYLDISQTIIDQNIDDSETALRTMLPGVTPPQPDRQGVEKIAEMLASASRPLLLIGKGASTVEAGIALERLVGRGIPFVASPTGRGTIPDDNPMSISSARNTAIRGADAILMVGARFNWIFQQGRGLSAGVRIAQIDVEAEEMWNNVDLEVGLVADSAAAVEQIDAALQGRKLNVSNSNWMQTLRAAALKNEGSVAEQMTSDETPINHYRLVADVRDCLERDATVVEDGNLTMAVVRQIMPSFLPRHRLSSGTTGCMGTGLPYAVGMKLARPNQQVVAILGDYAFGAAPMEVETCARLGINVVIVVSNNAGISGGGSQARFPDDAPPIAAMLPIDYEKMVEMVGGYAARVTNPADIKPAVQRALQANTVSLVNVITDPDAASGRQGRRQMMYL